MKNIKLPSGVELKLSPAPFADANALYKAVAAEAKGVNVTREMDPNLIKDAICILISSEKIEACLWKCFERALYNGIKITQETFDDEKAREEYFSICKEVLWYNISPFLKSLYSEFAPLVKAMEKITLE